MFEPVRRALAEDIGSGDITTMAVFPKAKTVQAEITAKEPGVLAGIFVSMAAFKLLDPNIKFMPLIRDGKIFKANAVISRVEGDVRSILSAERVALNFLSRLSGIATLTSQFVSKIKPYKTKIMDTRKTTPGLRPLEKYAVTAGGGYNHRSGLYDQILIKDNHLKAAGYDWARIQAALKAGEKKRVVTEVEVANIREFKEALKCKPDIIMLDNMSLKEIKTAVKFRDSLSTMPVRLHFGGDHRLSTKLEASGGVSLNNIRTIAATGVDMISVGALTHSSKPIDFSLEI